MAMSLEKILAYVRKQQVLDREALLLEPDVDERDIPDGMKARYVYSLVTDGGPYLCMPVQTGHNLCQDGCSLYQGG